MSATDSIAVLERQLLLQLGDRLKRLRKAQGLSTVEMAKRVGISRTTLSAVDAGDPGPSIGTYLRVMSVPGISGELALLAGDTMQPAPPGSAGACSRRARPVVQVLVSADESRHEIQDLQSLALHEEAVRLIRADPALMHQAEETLQRWCRFPFNLSLSIFQLAPLTLSSCHQPFGLAIVRPGRHRVLALLGA